MTLTPEQIALLRHNLNLTGDGNVVGNNNTVSVTKQTAGDYAIQIGTVALTLPAEFLLSLLTAYTPPAPPDPEESLPPRSETFVGREQDVAKVANVLKQWFGHF